MGLKFFQRLPPFSLMRMAGPMTAPFFRLCRQDIIGRFEQIYEVQQRRIVSEYVTHCNNISISGERSFHRLMCNGPWPRYPIGEKIRANLCPRIPLTFVYGEQSWLDSSFGEKVKETRVNSYTTVHMVKDAGHKVFSDQEKIFNEIVNEACKILKSDLERWWDLVIYTNIIIVFGVKRTRKFINFIFSFFVIVRRTCELFKTLANWRISDI